MDNRLGDSLRENGKLMALEEREIRQTSHWLTHPRLLSCDMSRSQPEHIELQIHLWYAPLKQDSFGSTDILQTL